MRPSSEQRLTQRSAGHQVGCVKRRCSQGSVGVNNYVTSAVGSRDPLQCRLSFSADKERIAMSKGKASL